MQSRTPAFTRNLKAVNVTSFSPFAKDASVNIWDLFPPELSCPDIQRVGSVGDGGKWICGLSWLGMNRQNEDEKCIVYSYGVSTDSTFEQELSSVAGCKVFAFDPTIGEMKSAGESITFHKMGLWNSSGSTDNFMLVEHLYDAMNRLNHSYIDVLKVDIEGAEWAVFRELLSRANGRSGLFPFGQLLIELHYESVESTAEFFLGMMRHGFLAFSREVNLQPCLNGRPPVAVEYSFINAGSFFESRSVKSPSRINHASFRPPIVTPTWHEPVRAVIYFLTHRGRVSMMRGALRSLYRSFYRQFPLYDILVFHDDLLPADKDTLQSAVPDMPLRFISIRLRTPPHLNEVVIPDIVPHCSPGSSTLGYRHMVMFHAAGIHAYLFDPDNGYSDVEYILRLDDDSRFSAPIGYDLFRFMRVNNMSYGFVNVVPDDPGCVQGLWNHSYTFIKEAVNSGIYINPKNVDLFFNHWEEGKVVYNNFEISRASIWRSPLWRAFFDSVDKSGRVYTHRWGDAPLHTIFVLLGIPSSAVHVFGDIAYSHPPFAGQKPGGLPMPGQHPFLHRVDGCAYYNQWTCGNQSLLNSTQKTSTSLSGGVLSPLWGVTANTTSLKFRIEPQPVVEPQHVFSGGKSDRSERHARSMIVSRNRKRALNSSTGVLYTFGHRDRLNILASTVTSFVDNYAKAHHCPIVIFIPSSLNSTMIWHFKNIQLDARASSLVTLVPVDLSPFASAAKRRLTNKCGGKDIEVAAASVFLMKSAALKLHDMGYDWFFRFADNSKLFQPIGYDVFDKLKKRGARYGFRSVVKDDPACTVRLWDYARLLCDESSSCSDLLSTWPAGVVVFTNFEISHISVWQSSIFKNISSRAEGMEAWGDAAVHTLSVISSLKYNEILRFEDIKYDAIMNGYRDTSNTTIRSSQFPGQEYRPLPQLDLKFRPQRFGWLGGDVASSFCLPDIRHLESQQRNNSKCEGSRYIWLFGDTFIGTSTATRRLEAQIISNSVAIVDIRTGMNSNGVIQRSSFYWKSETDGMPAPIFSDSSPSEKFWPMSGLSVVDKDAGWNDPSVKVVVVGQQVKSLSRNPGDPLEKAAGILSFTELASVAVVVENPKDPPDMWHTVVHPLKFSTGLLATGKVRWIYMAQSNGRLYADSNDYIFLLGTYDSSINDDSFDLNSLTSDRKVRIIGRIPAMDLLHGNVETMQVLVPSSPDSWANPSQLTTSIDYHRLAALPGGVSEASLHFDHNSMSWVVTTLEMNDDFITLCRSFSIEGPWRCSPGPVITSPWNDKQQYMSYAAKSHPELSGGNGTVLSFIANTAQGVHELFDEINFHTYTPIFLLYDV